MQERALEEDQLRKGRFFEQQQEIAIRLWAVGEKRGIP